MTDDANLPGGSAPNQMPPELPTPEEQFQHICFLTNKVAELEHVMRDMVKMIKLFNSKLFPNENPQCVDGTSDQQGKKNEPNSSDSPRPVDVNPRNTTKVP